MRFLSSGMNSAFARLSSGTKMLLIMTGALLPLGIIALFTSVQSARDKQRQHEADTRLIATAEARQIDLILVRGASILRAAAAGSAGGRDRCRRVLDEASRLIGPDARLALLSPDGSPRCATRDFSNVNLPVDFGGAQVRLQLLPGDGGIRFAIAAGDGSTAVGELPRAMLVRSIGATGGNQGILLRQGAATLPLVSARATRALDRRITVSAPVGGGQILLVSTVYASAISIVEILLVLLPLLMWAAAAIIGASVINGLLIRPLGQLQRAVAQLGAAPLALPKLQTPAQEIQALAESFRLAAEQLASREAALEQGLQHQVRLTREVHHRVKNNLQVVASLIALHARGASGEVAAAYASIQRRVDALAVVHRNHYAELEENRGVALRSLIGELTSNLRATAPAEAAHFQIMLDMAAVHVTQDVAVPVAFLITEMIELLMIDAPTDPVMIAVRTTDAPDRAMLAIRAPGLAHSTGDKRPERIQFDRIVAGLARQVRTALELDEESCTYRVLIGIVPDGGTEKHV